MDVRDPVQSRRLRAFTWADQRERLARLDAAVAEMLANPVTVEQADAATWLPDRIPSINRCATVVAHSAVWQYVSEESRQGVLESLRIGAENASVSRPLAWLRAEPPEPTARMEVLLTIWPDGETTKLADVHPHGQHIRWSGT